MLVIRYVRPLRLNVKESDCSALVELVSDRRLSMLLRVHIDHSRTDRDCRGQIYTNQITTPIESDEAMLVADCEVSDFAETILA